MVAFHIGATPGSTPADVTTLDTHIRELLERGELAGAVSALLDAHGADVFGFVLGVLDNARRARVAYAGVAKHVSTELEHFQWKCSPKVWLYSLAHRELAGRRTHVEPDETKRVAAGEIRRLLGVIEAVRSGLTEEERELLILRLDRQLDWHTLAIIQLGETATETAIAQEARGLRERIEGLLERLESVIQLHLRNVR